jgi:hypothetical protein
VRPRLLPQEWEALIQPQPPGKQARDRKITDMKTTSSIFIPMKSHRLIRWIVILTAAAGLGHAACGAEAANADPGITVASYYFGQYHPNDPRNLKVRGGEWSEWELIKAAKPRFPGHQQPKVPLWGYEDESDPKVMADRKSVV